MTDQPRPNKDFTAEATEITEHSRRKKCGSTNKERQSLVPTCTRRSFSLCDLCALCGESLPTAKSTASAVQTRANWNTMSPRTILGIPCRVAMKRAGERREGNPW